MNYQDLLLISGVLAGLWCLWRKRCRQTGPERREPQTEARKNARIAREIGQWRDGQ